ncbi:PREDICTED: glucose dehydrogenase [FAD, quinone]-like [Ceratosolen solmsi marchali]|uniref:Glucose dehydrogenase [FAD, quinone]-like n=1 Tax=Ceratosolen solmsi marchali TaxID=326594 RepID=A0AAJ7DZ75_9HYME|nr:PREDICTED: glucose dehydrogenase [FAD, quinone]-like [Ceratosolen solmsi marchali]
MNSACGRHRSFMTMLQTLVMSQCDLADPCRRAGTDTLPPRDWFDFIIVGAGVAGPIIAKRLSDNQQWQVLLVEAGPEEPTLTSLPGLSFSAINSSLDWKYLTEPTQPYPTACLENGGVCSWPRGKMVSGTGGMYGMMYVRGHPSIYDEWERMGNPGWSYKELEEYFERAENPISPEFARNKMFKKINTGAPMTIDYFGHRPYFAEEMLNAAAELGYRISGLRDTSQTGFMVAPMLTQDGMRGTTSRYYLRPSSNRPNLHVLINAHVTKILFMSEINRAYGIELIDKDGEVRKFMANNEIILTAGAIGSPQILLHSGIGPKGDLEKLNIPVIQDLPVGKNLQNHVSVAIKMSIMDNDYESLSLDSVNQYVFNRSGPVSSTGLTQLTAFLESDFAVPGVPDIQVFFDDFSTGCARASLDSRECLDESLDSCAERRLIVARPTVVRTNSRGYLKLRSDNPLDHPLIYPNYFTNVTDLKILVQGIKKVVELTKTIAMWKWDLKLEPHQHPWCSRFHFGTEAYWQCLARVKTGPENHQSGTCRMGGDEFEAVVDHELRVHGVRNVRVADASVFPVLTNANPVSAIVVVAEKAASMISDFWRRSPWSEEELTTFRAIANYLINRE